MLHNHVGGTATVAADRDAPLTIDDLPPRYNRRWSAQQQRQVLGAIDNGSLTASEAILRYALGADDLVRWRRAAADRPEDAIANAPAVEASHAADRLSRLIDVLMERGLIDAFDAASIERPRDKGLAALFAQFIVDDAPIV